MSTNSLQCPPSASPASAFESPAPIEPGTHVGAAPAVGPTMSCPACGFEQRDGAECVKCGVVVSKYRARPEPTPAPLPEVRTQDEIASDLAEQGYTPKRERDSVVHHDTDEDNSFFAPEKRGLAKGVFGGLVMMGIAVVWFGLGWAAGYIFFYPPVLFVIGLFGMLKGMFTGNVAG